MVTESRLGRILLWCGVVGPAFFVVSFLVQGAVRPGYDPLRHPVSSLSLGGGAAWVQPATFLITGLLVSRSRWASVAPAAAGGHRS